MISDFNLIDSRHRAESLADALQNKAQGVEMMIRSELEAGAKADARYKNNEAASTNHATWARATANASHAQAVKRKSNIAAAARSREGQPSENDSQIHGPLMLEPDWGAGRSARENAAAIERTGGQHNLRARRVTETAMKGLGQRLRTYNERASAARTRSKMLGNKLKALYEGLTDNTLELPKRPAFSTLEGTLSAGVDGTWWMTNETDNEPSTLKVTCARATPVHAVAQGRVAWVGAVAKNLSAVIIEHGEGFSSIYTAVTPEVDIGEWPNTGDPIGTACNERHNRGKVGIQVRKGTTALNPERWFIQPRGARIEPSTHSPEPNRKPHRKPH